MEAVELLAILAHGEDSHNQFNRDLTNADGVAAELAALANSGRGQPFIGVNNDGKIAGLCAEDVRRLNHLVSNAATTNVRPPVQHALALNDEERFRTAYLQPALKAELVDITSPGKPRSSKHRYRLTMDGQCQKALGKSKGEVR